MNDNKNNHTTAEELHQEPIVKEQAENPEENLESAAADVGPEIDTAQSAEELKRQYEEMRNKYLYLLSDFQNYKRHVAKERMELQVTAGRDILAALLPVLDDFDRAARNNAIDEGIALIHHKLVQTLQSKGLQPIEVQAGLDFDPDTQEAVAEVPAPSEQLKGKIVDIVEKGYRLGDRILRYAKVVVGK